MMIDEKVPARATHHNVLAGDNSEPPIYRDVHEAIGHVEAV